MTDETQEQIEQRPAIENDGWEWMLIETMGHRRHWGRTRQEERFGAKMIRVDIPVKGDPAVHGWTSAARLAAIPAGGSPANRGVQTLL